MTNTVSASPRFSIVIPAYNSEQTIASTLESCFAQRFTDFEILLIDDGSTDGTAAVLAGVEDTRLRVIQQANAGPAAARNRGMAQASGQYIAFLDADDRWLPDYLDAVDACLQSTPGCLVYGRIIVDRGVSRYWVKPDRALQVGESIYDYLYIHGGFIQTSTLVIPSTLAREVAWDESVTFGDNDQFAIDCWHTGRAFHMIEGARTLYNDVLSSTALSQLPIHAGTSERYTNFFTWMQLQRPRMSEKAWLAFRARFESVALARHDPTASLALLWQAWKGNAIGSKAILRQTLQNLTPRLYRRLTDLYVRLNGSKWPAP